MGAAIGGTVISAAFLFLGLLADHTNLFASLDRIGGNR